MISALFMTSCKDPVDSDTDTDTNDSDVGTDTSSDKKPSKEDDDEEDEGPSYNTVIEHKLTIDDIINLDIFNTTVEPGSASVKDYGVVENIDVSDYNGQQIDILKGGVYKLTGVSNGGNILINLKNALEKDITLVFDNLEIISNWQKAPIYASGCDSVTIVIPEGTTNTLKDCDKSIDKGAIHVKSCNLTISGTGTLNVESSAEKGRGIYCSKELIFNGGTYNVVSHLSHGLQGQDGLTIKAGEFYISSAKSGLKSGDYDETPDPNNPKMTIIESSEGDLKITGGCINIDSTTNGISAYGGALISGGKIVIKAKTDGIEASREKASENEQTGSITINGAILIVESGDDGIKCDTSLTITNNANVKINSGKDGIDALNAAISTSGIVYIKTSEAFVEKTEDDFKNDPNGKTYIWKNNRYQEISDISKYPDATFYKLESCKGIKVEEEIEILSGTVCVDSYEDAFSGQRFDMSGGRILIDSNDDGIDIKKAEGSIDGSGNVKITSGTVEIIKTNKGIKAENVTISGDPQITVLSSGDAIEANSAAISGGFVVLMEKLEVPEEGVSYTGGTLVVVSSTKNGFDGAYLGVSLSKTDKCTYGNWLKISKGDRSLILMLPKSYVGKMSVSISSSDMMSGDYNFEVGSFKISGERYNSFVYADGDEFTAVHAETVSANIAE